MNTPLLSSKMMGKHPKRFNASTLLVTTARLRTKTGCFNIGKTMNSDCDLSPLLHIWEGGGLWLAHGGPTKVANNSPSPHPPLQKQKKYNFWQNYMLLA